MNLGRLSRGRAPSDAGGRTTWSSRAPIAQRWRWRELNVTIDFLIPPLANAPQGGQIKHLEGEHHQEPAGDATHEELHVLALRFAHADAHLGHYRSALRWLQIVEKIDLTLEPELVDLRERWERANARRGMP